MFLLFNWEGSSGVQAVLGMINNILKIIRWVVPIGLIIMTSLDVAKKVINPEDKEGIKKIMYRVVAALIVFLAPTMINFVLKLVNIGNGKSGGAINNGNSSSNNKEISANNVNILYCPTSSLYINSKGNLSAQVPNTYKGDFYWHVDKGQNSISIYPQDNGKSITYMINKYPSNGEVIISLSIDNGKITKSCYINVKNISVIDY